VRAGPDPPPITGPSPPPPLSRGPRGAAVNKAGSVVGAASSRSRVLGRRQYQCCGLLQQDLTELCAWAGITSIPRVTVRPSSAAGEELGAAGGAGRKRFDSSDTASPTAEGAEPCRLGERCIQVELQNDSDPRSVCGVFLRGWKVEEEMLGVLSKCLPALANLKVLNLGAVLPHRSLTLEGNPLPEHSFHVLMGASSTLSHLSLRNNCIDDRAAQLLGQGLSSMSSSNHSLLSLVLSFNRISDVGAEHIAEGLRWNRSLLSLSLAHNRIGDVGAVKLAEVLQPFKLRHEEVVERRRLLMEEQGHSCHSALPAATAPSDSRRSRGAKGAIGEQQGTEVSSAVGLGGERGEGGALWCGSSGPNAPRQGIQLSPGTHCWSRACTAMGMSSCLGTGCSSTSTCPVSVGLGGAWLQHGPVPMLVSSPRRQPDHGARPGRVAGCGGGAGGA
uniref:Leucine rich repeat containing 71 n=1 Tax=Phasianus colchicus TaxID=9054 RepID=A0A669QNG1_PHACC